MSSGPDPLGSLSTLGAAIDAIIKRTVIETLKALQDSNAQPAKLLTVEELAAELKISKFSVYDMSRRGLLPTHRIGKSLRFDLNEVLASQKKI